MKNFLRVVRAALQYRLTFLAALACSVLVAFLWGGNITAVYPIVQVAFHGKSMQQWADEEIDKAEIEAQRLEVSIKDLRQQAENAPPPVKRKLQRQIQSQRDRLRAEQRALAIVGWVKPFIYDYLPTDPFQTVVIVVMVVMLATIVKDIGIVFNMVLVERLVQLATFDFRKQYFHHMLRMDLKTIGGQGTAGWMSHFVEISQLGTGIRCLFGSAIREPLKIIACIVGASLISWRLLLFSMVLAPLAVFLVRKLAGSIKRANRRAMEELKQLNQVLFEALSGIQSVQAYTMEQFERSRFRRVARECIRKALRIVFYNSLTKPATEVSGIAVVCLSLVAGAYLVLNQETHLLGMKMCDRPLSIASLLVFYGLLIGTSDPARKLSDIYTSIQAGLAAAERVFPILDRQSVIADPTNPKPLPQPHRELVFDHVSFHYESEKPVLRDTDLRIPFGETIAIVGPNGCGKTTLVNLIPRFYDPVEGAVRLGDLDLRDVKLRELRRRIGLVCQQTLLFDDTVRNNIRYGSPHATDEEVAKAAKRARAHRFITEDLEQDYNTCVGQGGNRLSGGQRQRIALARAILRDPEILILDEATSQIDLESEQLIHQALERFIRGRTAVIITHRLSTLDLADRIVVMDGGRINDVGKHEELIQRCELYRGLYEIHFKQSVKQSA